MKKSLLSALFSLAVIAFLVSPASAEFKKTKIAVLDFQLQGNRQDSTDMGKIVAEWLITALVKEGRFDVIERRLLEKVLEEQKIGVSGIVDENSASKLGKVLGAKIVITGSVMEFQNIIEVNARIIEVESSSIIAAESVKSTNAVKLEDLVVQMADKIIADFPLEGYIVERDGDTALIDLGQRTGVKKKMQFIVYREGKIIKHPKTGEILDIERIETGAIEITDIKSKTASAVIVRETSPDAIASGQLVKSNIELATLDTSIQPEEVATKKKRGRERKQERAVPDADYASQLTALDSQINDIKRLKENGNSSWKDKYKEVMSTLKSLEGNTRKSAEVQLTYGKVYYAIDKMSDAEKFIKKAESLRPQYAEAFMLKGDIDFELVRNANARKQRKMGYGKKARQDYETGLEMTQDPNVQAMLYYKLGTVYADLEDDQDTAKQYWMKAMNTAPGSEAARLAKTRY